MINALLVRWARGWHEVTDSAAISAHGRTEGTISLGSQESVAEVERVARGQLALDVREAVEVDLAPVDASDTPYQAFAVGDVVSVPDVNGAGTLERVTVLTVAEDENRQLSWVPELKDVLLTQQERQDQAIARMASGSLAGVSTVASPVAGGLQLSPIAGGGGGPGPVPVASLTPAVIMTGVVSTLSDEVVLPYADDAFESAALYGVVDIVEGAPGYGTTVFIVRDPCTLVLSMVADFSLGSAPPEAGHLWIGMLVDPKGGTISDNWGAHRGTTTEYRSGPWMRTSFPASAPDPGAGLTLERVVRFDNADETRAAVIVGQLFHAWQTSVEFRWQITARRIDSLAEHTWGP